MPLIDAKKVQEEAEKELREEDEKVAKSQIKRKMREIKTAEIVVSNLRRDLDDLMETIGEGNGE